MANIPSLPQLFPGLNTAAPAGYARPARTGDRPGADLAVAGWPPVGSQPWSPVGLPGVPVIGPGLPGIADGGGRWNPPVPYGPHLVRTPEVGDLPSWARAVLALPVEHFKEQGTAAPSSPDKRLTHIGFALDASGSMLAHKAAVVEGFNTQVSKIKASATDIGAIAFTSVKFNDQVAVAAERTGIDQLVPLSDDSYQPGGGTALYDAIGDAIGALLRCPQAQAPETAFLLTVFTDGQELSSRRFARADLRGLIERLEATGRWTFALMGPSGSVHGLSDALGLQRSNVGEFNPHVVGAANTALGQVTGATESYLSARAAGASQVVGLYAGG